MSKGRVIVGLVGLITLVSWSLSEIKLKYPKSWPEPVYDFKSNPLKPEVVSLGRRLFYEPKLSRDNTISCSSCYLSFTSFTHVDHELSHGIEGKIGRRNSPVLVNLAWQKHFMWDGGVNHMDVQALAPITNPLEMDEVLSNVVKKLRAEGYADQFKKAFGDTAITGERILKSLSHFQLTFVSQNSKYDSVMVKKATFTGQEAKGFELFNAHCNRCHTAPLFTNGEFANNGLPVDTFLHDSGRYEVTRQIEDQLKFKVPTLRNISFSFPYMHDGRFKKLYQVLKHYQSGVQRTNNVDSLLVEGLPLSNNDLVDLIAFLKTLDDKTFMFNENYAFPK